MKIFILSAAILFAVTGCSASEQTPTPDPVQSSSTKLPGGMKVIGPVFLGENDTSALVTAGVDTIVFDLPNPADWEATLTPQDLATFLPGTDDSTVVNNPSLYPVKAGQLTVVLTNKEGRTLQYVITITTANTNEEIDSIEDPAAASDALGMTLIGMFEVDAVDAIENSGRVARIAERDGEGFMLTKDYNPKRLNLVIVTGIVSSFYVG